MGKVLILIVTALVGWFLFKGIVGKSSVADKAKSTDRLSESERMVKCDLCGVHMPESESKLSGGKRSCQAPDACAHRLES